MSLLLSSHLQSCGRGPLKYTSHDFNLYYCCDEVRLCLCGTSAYMSEYGAAVELYWHGKTKGVGEKSVPVPLCPVQIQH
jgi:hypothetical protein